MTVSIVIPVFNQYPLLHRLLFDIYQKCSKMDEVVIVNDCSTDEEVVTGLSWWKETKMLPIREIRNKENKGFLLSSNYGLRKAIGDVKILISTDVRVVEDLVYRVVHALNNNPKTLVGGILYRHDTGWNTFGKKTFPYLEGWLLAMTSDGWKALEYFDERFSPNDYEDIDISTNALKHGYELMALAPDVAVHMGGKSIGYSPEREVLTKRNQKKFEAKWVINSSQKS